MHTAARMYNAAKEGSSLLTEGGKAAAEIKRSAARHSASLGAAIGLAKVTDNFKSVASQFEVNKPNFLAAHNLLRETKRAYLQGCAAQRSAIRGSKLRLLAAPCQSGRTQRHGGPLLTSKLWPFIRCLLSLLLTPLF